MEYREIIISECDKEFIKNELKCAAKNAIERGDHQIFLSAYSIACLVFRNVGKEGIRWIFDVIHFGKEVDWSEYDTMIENLLDF